MCDSHMVCYVKPSCFQGNGLFKDRIDVLECPIFEARRLTLPMNAFAVFTPEMFPHLRELHLRANQCSTLHNELRQWIQCAGASIHSMAVENSVIDPAFYFLDPSHVQLELFSVVLPPRPHTITVCLVSARRFWNSPSA